MLFTLPNMSSRTIMVVFTALAVFGATMALSTTGFFDTTGISSAYAQGDNMTGGNMTNGNMTNMTGDAGALPPPPPAP
jgi:hypothetical protein